MLNTPVLFLVFNRPDTTKQVFEAIRKAQPKQLFVAADGPRSDKPGEKEKTEEVRRIATAVDWDCDLKTLFRDENLGCGRGPATAITWFFENVEKGIILEDDCLPNESFFKFCEELLEYYKDDERIMHISGNNFQFGKKIGKASYYFSKYSHNWGWATWSRAWKHYQFKLFDLDEVWTSLAKIYSLEEKEKDYWWKIFDELRDGKNDVWDGQWQFSIWKNSGLSILPNNNLITNIGFTKDATHTIQEDSILSNISTKEILKIDHPVHIQINKKADLNSFKKVFLLKPFNKVQSLMLKIKNW